MIKDDSDRWSDSETVINSVRQYKNLTQAYPDLDDAELSHRMVEPVQFVKKARRFFRG